MISSEENNYSVNSGDIEGQPIYMVLYPTLRSQLLNTFLFFFCLIGAIILSHMFPMTVIKGSLLPFFGGNDIFLSLPILILVPGIFLGKILINLYDCKYIFDETGVEAQIGLVSLSLRQPKLRWEDIRGSEPIQTLLERILGIGSVLIGSAAQQDVEIIMKGVPDPKGLQAIIQRERAKKNKEFRTAVAPGAASTLVND